MKIAYLIEPPFNYLDDDGRLTGCDIAVARHVCDQLGIPDPEFIETEFAQLIPGLTRGEWEMTTGLLRTWERQKVARFSRPIWALPDGLLIRTSDIGRIAGYRSIAGREDLSIAIVQDQMQHRTALALGVPAWRVAVFDTYVDAAQAVADGAVSAFASVKSAHDGFLQRYDGSDLSSVEVSHREKAPADGCFACALPALKLQSRVNHVLAEYLGSPEHRQMMRGYGFMDEEIDRVQRI